MSLRCRVSATDVNSFDHQIFDRCVQISISFWPLKTIVEREERRVDCERAGAAQRRAARVRHHGGRRHRLRVRLDRISFGDVCVSSISHLSSSTSSSIRAQLRQHHAHRAAVRVDRLDAAAQQTRASSPVWLFAFVVSMMICVFGQRNWLDGYRAKRTCSSWFVLFVILIVMLHCWFLSVKTGYLEILSLSLVTQSNCPLSFELTFCILFSCVCFASARALKITNSCVAETTATQVVELETGVLFSIRRLKHNAGHNCRTSCHFCYLKKNRNLFCAIFLRRVRAVTLMNPQTIEFEICRTSLLPGMFKTVRAIRIPVSTICSSFKNKIVLINTKYKK